MRTYLHLNLKINKWISRFSLNTFWSHFIYLYAQIYTFVSIQRETYIDLLEAEKEKNKTTMSSTWNQLESKSKK